MTEFNEYTLPNGIRCIHKQVKSLVVHCALTIGTGSRDERADEHGLAHLLEHCFFKGTEHRKAYHINCRLENLGGELNAFTTKEETVIHTTSLRADLNKAADLIADIVFHSVFPEREIEKEKLVIVDEINSYKDSPMECIFDEFEDRIFAGSTLGHNILGDKKSLKKLSRADLKDFIDRTYNTDQMVFSVIGNISVRRFQELCQRFFSAVPATNRSFDREQPNRNAAFTETVNRKNHQVHCLIGKQAYSLKDPKRIPFSLLTNMLGGPSANSLLNLTVREKYGLAYNIEAGFNPYTDTGIATIYFGTEKDQLDLCQELIRKELDKLRAGKISDRYFNMAKKQFIGQMTIAMESNENYMLGAGRSFLHYNHVDKLEEVHRKVNAIRLEDVISVSEEIYGSELSTLLYR